jgi:hypothetical protein
MVTTEATTGVTSDENKPVANNAGFIMEIETKK